MNDQIEQLELKIGNFTPENMEEVERFRIDVLGKKGLFTDLFEAFKRVPGEEKKLYGQRINILKKQAQSAIEEAKERLKQSKGAIKIEDPSLPGKVFRKGSLHPVQLVMDEILDIFLRLGFNISEGPEIVSDWENFGALNFEPHHPARDMQDTFFISRDPDFMLRTHSSSVQVREMEKGELPIRSISPGRVFRNETISARSHCQFHQIEGLYIAEKVSFADLRQTLYTFARAYFGEDVKVRFRPSYFPFTEPSAEMDIYKGLESEADKRLTKGTGWLEILGCGMVDPNVLEACKIDPNKYSGYAFGLGIERIALLKYKIDDIRTLFENDIRFLRQFEGVL